MEGLDVAVTRSSQPCPPRNGGEPGRRQPPHFAMPVLESEEAAVSSSPAQRRQRFAMQLGQVSSAPAGQSPLVEESAPIGAPSMEPRHCSRAPTETGYDYGSSEDGSSGSAGQGTGTAGKI